MANPSERTEECCYPVDCIAFLDMATAVSRIYIPEGFVIAADGREIESATGTVVSDREQKIFPLRHQHGAIACTVTGTGRIGEHYRLSNEVQGIAATLEACDALNVGEYAEHLAIGLRRSIETRFPQLDKPVTIQLLFDGYIRHRPERARATIRYGLGVPKRFPVGVETQSLWQGKSIGYGSNLIHEALFARSLRHEALRPYWNVCQQDLRAIDQSISVARAVIEGQCVPQVASLDPGLRGSIGGHVHIAVVTASHGFEWAIAPLPLE